MKRAALSKPGIVFSQILLASCGACRGNRQASALPADASGAEPSARLFRVLKGGKFGFIDRRGEVVVEPRFDHAEDFSEGLAAVAVSGKWGYIDKTGGFVLGARFNARAFDEGLAFVKVGGYDADAIVDVVGAFDTGGEWAYIDKSGEYVWPPTN